MGMEEAPNFDDVLAARDRIAPHVHRTAVLTCSALNERTGAKLFFKCENFQRSGAFKARGAFNAVFLHGHACGEMMFMGRGAGDLPTASAIVSDLVRAASAQ